MDNNQRFDSVLYGIPARIRQSLSRLSDTVKLNCEEIRLRRGLPIALTVCGETVFVKESGQTCFYITKDLLKAESKDLEECFKLLCNSSAFAHSEELKNGFIIMKNGSRAGICGTVTENGMRDISSVNIRIAREIFGSANEILSNYAGGGLLIAGPPGSGKTTVLRDLCRQLSNGQNGRIQRVAVIDSRGEISGSSGGVTLNDLGANTDVLMTYNKASGIEIALRTMFPDIIAFDEIGTVAELKKVSESFCAGVEIITTAHIGNKDELMSRAVTAELIKSGAVKKIALLPRLHAGKITVIDTKEPLSSAVI